MLQLQSFCEAVHLEVAACLGLELSTAVGMLSAEPGRSSEAAAALLANHALPSCSIGATTLALAAATECDNGPLKLNVAYTQGCCVACSCRLLDTYASVQCVPATGGSGVDVRSEQQA